MFVGSFQDVRTPRSQSRWRRTWPESETRDPRRNEMPRQGGERKQHKGLACTHWLEVNVVSNYQTRLTQAYTKPVEALWQQHQIVDTEIQLLHDCPSSTLPSFPLDSKQGRLWLTGQRKASQGLPVVVKSPPIWRPRQQASFFQVAQVFHARITPHSV